MLIGIVAVTKTKNGFCVAGVDAFGNLVRPICGTGSRRFWTRKKLSHSGGFIKCGDVWELKGEQCSSEFPNHTEDFFATSFNYKKSLTNDKFMNILSNFSEGEQEFLDTVNANKRSLCLISVSSFNHITKYWEGQPKLRMFLAGAFPVSNPKTNDNTYPIKDCKWVSLLNDNFRPPQFKQIFVTIGLATPTYYDSTEYPQIIGIHTSPNVKFTESYPD